MKEKFSIDYLKLRLKWELKKMRIKRNSEISKRILARENIFWPSPSAELLKYEELSLKDLKAAKQKKNWQRYLFNKLNVEKFVNSLGIKTPKIYWKGRDVENIDFSALPEAFVIKPNYGHSSSMIYPLNNMVNSFTGNKMDSEQIVSELKLFLKENEKLEFYIEEFVKDENEVLKIPTDYKLYTFNGHVACIQVINRSGANKAVTTFYDIDWKPTKAVTVRYSKGEIQSPPACLNEMLDSAKKLSKQYEIFCRIDFYASSQGAVFSEFTPTPNLGTAFTSFGDKLLISFWDKYCKNMI